MYLYFLLLLFENFSLWLFNKNYACERKRISKKKHSFINSKERGFSEQQLTELLIIRIANFS